MSKTQTESPIWKGLPYLLLLTSSIIFLAGGWGFPFFYDDAFISFRITENWLATGKPYFNQNEPVFTNTSLSYPIWNAIWASFFGEGWTSKIPIINAVLQVLVLLRLAWLVKPESGESKTWSISILAMLPILLSPTQLSTGNSGLETAFFQAFIALVFFAPRVNSWSWLAIFIRPEGILLGAALAITDWWKTGFKHCLRKHLLPFSLSLFLAVFLSWYWYGTLIPQSIVAKSNYVIDRWQQIQNGFQYLFLQGNSWFILVVGATLIRFPDLIKKTFAPYLLWCLVYVFFFSILASWWAWYVPPLLIPMAWMVGRSAQLWQTEWAAFQKSRFISLMGILILLTLWQVWKSFEVLEKNATAFQVREASSRKIGQWLQEHVGKNESVLVEPLGLIGYYGGYTRFLDYPGLSQPEMSQFLAGLPWKIPIQMVDARTDSVVLTRFQPDWLILFPYERKVFQNTIPFIKGYHWVDSLPYYPLHEEFKMLSLAKKNEF